MESQEGKPHKVEYICGWDIKENKRLYCEGEVVNYLPGEVVEVKSKGRKKVRLYKSEYINIK